MKEQEITTPVYVTPAGKRYHTSNGCFRLLRRAPDTVRVVSLRKAEDYGKSRCQNCP